MKIYYRKNEFLENTDKNPFNISIKTGTDIKKINIVIFCNNFCKY